MPSAGCSGMLGTGAPGTHRRPPLSTATNPAGWPGCTGVRRLGAVVGSLLLGVGILLLGYGCSDEPAAPAPAVPADSAMVADASGQDAAVETALAADVSPVAAPRQVVKRSLFAIEPDEGPSGGLTVVTLRGIALGGVTEVRFGESPAVFLQVLDDGTVVATTPPRPPGFVDVIVRSPDHEDLVLSNGYRYTAEVAVHAVSPASGPAAGGTVVTVTGAGFTPDTQFAIGGRLALSPAVIDEQTAVVVTPPGTAGAAAVVAGNGDGNGVLAKGFAYLQAPLLIGALPGAVPLQGGKVVLSGNALVANGGLVHLLLGDKTLTVAIVQGSADATALTILVPPLPANAQGALVQGAGPWDVRFANAQGLSVLGAALSFVAPATTPQILTVAPYFHPVNALGPVDVTVAGPWSQGDLASASVQFGGLAAKLLATQPAGALAATLRVQPPMCQAAVLPATVDVTVQLGAVKLSKVQAFTCTPAIPVVVSAAPGQLAAAGGTAIVVTFEAAGAGAVTGLRIGALLASQVKVVGPGVVSALAPAGSPGPADVTVSFAGGKVASKPKLVQFLGNSPKVVALYPGRGSQAGGTLVDVIGSGLAQATGFTLGGAKVTEVVHVHDGLVRIRTPRGSPGPATLLTASGGGTGSDGAATQVLAKAFTYFDPQAGDAGTWGPAIDGAVNVTVNRKGKGQPIQGALVILGNDPQTLRKGLTDDRGQITFSDVGLVGPVNVHAAKPGFAAGSVIALGVENVTIRLQEFPKPPTSSGSGAPPDPIVPLPDGAITGTVVDAEKYTVLPPGSCAGHAIVAGQCAPCTVDADCAPCPAGANCNTAASPKLVCASHAPPLEGPAFAESLPEGATGGVVPVGKASYCSAPCSANADCPGGFQCRAVVGSPIAYRCVPVIGVFQVRCEAASPSIFGGAVQAEGGGIVNKNGIFLVKARPGDTAVICRSGYVDAKTGAFVALAMGLARKLYVVSGKTQTGVKVAVQTPLNRKMRVRLESVPMGEDVAGSLRQMTAGLDLGAEGYVPMGQVSTFARTDVLTFTRQPGPGLFTGGNADIRYELYGGVSNKVGGAPNATAIGTGLDVAGMDQFLRWPAGAAAPIVGDAIGVIHALDGHAGLRVGVGDGGRIVVWTGGGFTQQSSPTSRDLHAIWLVPDTGDGWIGGDDGILLRRGPLGWAIWLQTAQARVVALHGRAGNDAWLADADAQLQHWDGTTWTSVPGPWPKGTLQPQPAGGVNTNPEPKRLRGLWHAPDGTLYAVGDLGTMLAGKIKGGPGTDAPLGVAWTPVSTSTKHDLHGLWGSSDGEVWVVGNQGFVGRWNGTALTKVATPTNRPLYAIRGFGNNGSPFPLHAVGGQGAWLRLDGDGSVHDATLPTVHTDLRGVVATFDGGLATAGQPVLAMGPYLELPYLVAPAPGKGLGDKVKWSHEPGVTPTLNVVRLADAQYNTRWEIFVRGSVTEVLLPDFQALGQFSPVHTGTVHVRVWRVYAPGLEVDHFNHKLINNYSWVSWAYNVVTAMMGEFLVVDDKWDPPFPGKTP